MTETSQVSETEQIKWIKEVPKFKDILHSPTPRTNIIHSIQQGDETKWKKVTREFTEREGLNNLQAFAQQTIDKAKDIGNQQIADEAETFRDNLGYIGESELHEATVGLAQHIKDMSQEGKNIYIYIAGNRSERYISLRIMEEFDELTEENPELRQKVKISDDPSEIVVNSLQNKGKVVIPDDFALSGTRIRGITSHIASEFVQRGVSFGQAKERTEALLVATQIKTRPDANIYQNAHVYSYYASPEKNFWEAGITGSHCSTDYGFESRIKDFTDFLQANDTRISPPLLTRIQRPYDNESTSHYFTGYNDPELQQRWGKIERKYSITPKAPTTPLFSSPQ